jgi:hypothetical protein
VTPIDPRRLFDCDPAETRGHADDAFDLEETQIVQQLRTATARRLGAAKNTLFHHYQESRLRLITRSNRGMTGFRLIRGLPYA